LIHFIRPHKGQITTASRVKEFLEGSEIIEQEKIHADPYSFRCIPQVHGASKMQLITSKKSLEINSVTDNPNIFIESDQIISGNFHGQPLALALDF
jgi:histidine ammonia-lyase